MNRFYLLTIGILAIVAGLEGMWIHADNYRITYWQNYSTQLSQELNQQNMAVLHLKQQSDTLENNIQQAEQKSKKLEKSEINRRKQVIRSPEIQDCKKAVAWGAVESAKIANNYYLE